MTVSILTQPQKDAVVTIYQQKAKTIKEMAQWLEVSERTIVRVLNQAGVLTEKQQEFQLATRALEVVRKYASTPEQLDFALTVATQVEDKGPSRDQIIKTCMDMEEGTWNALLADIITTRVAKSHNTHVQTAMLKIEREVNKHGST